MKISWLEDGAVAGGGIPVNGDDVRALQQQGISVILTLTEHPLPAAAQQVDGIRYLHLPIVDQKHPTVEQAQQGCQWIDEARAQGQAVYVHCAAGIGRTGTMLHAYLMWHLRDWEAAKNVVKQKRPASQYIMLSQVQKDFVDELAQLWGKA
jgi:atypical dual specificity phosphatase